MGLPKVSCERVRSVSVIENTIFYIVVLRNPKYFRFMLGASGLSWASKFYCVHYRKILCNTLFRFVDGFVLTSLILLLFE